MRIGQHEGDLTCECMSEVGARSYGNTPRNTGVEMAAIPSARQPPLHISPRYLLPHADGASGYPSPRHRAAISQLSDMTQRPSAGCGSCLNFTIEAVTHDMGACRARQLHRFTSFSRGLDVETYVREARIFFCVDCFDIRSPFQRRLRADHRSLPSSASPWPS